MSQRFFNPAPQYFYSGTPAAPLSGGLMYFYESGTSTPKDTYSDNGLSVPNTNPVVLSSSGVLPNVFLDGSYRVTLTDKNGVQQPGWPRDSVNSLMDIAFAAWDTTVTYGLGGANIVYASNGGYYVSIQANNTAHEPSASPLWWQPAFDYFAIGQTLVSPGYVVVGHATTGLTGISMVTKGGILAGDGTTAPQVLSVGTNGYVLSANSGTATGLEWIAQPNAAGNNIVVVLTGNGFGSTNTMIRRFTTTQTSTGSAITYADSAANGASFTINETGLYFVGYYDGATGGTMFAGVSLNSAQLTTAVNAITASTRLGMTNLANSSAAAIAVGGVYRFVATDVIRPHTGGANQLDANDGVLFIVRKVGTT